MSIIYTSTIPFLISKAHAYHSMAPSFQNIMAMVQAKSVGEIEAILQNTHYAEIVNENRPSVNLTDFEVALRRDFAQLLTRYTQAASPDVKPILEAYSITIEADNMNLILQAILKGNISKDILNNVIPVGKYGLQYYERMLGITKVEAAVDLIPHASLKRAVEEALKQTNDTDELTFYMSSALSHISYGILQEVAPGWVKNIIEMLNLETIARGVKLGINPSPWMIPSHGIVSQLAPTLVTMKTPREVFSFIANKFPVSHLVERALSAEDDDVVSVFEQVSQLYRFHQHQRNFKIYGNRKESILDFFVIKKAEIDDLSRILLSNIKSMSSDQIIDMLMTPIYRR